MSSPTWEDLNEFLSTDDFAVNGVIHLENGTTRSVNGIFDDPYQGAQMGQYERDQVRPSFEFKQSDAGGIHRGDWIVIGGETYDVMTTPQRDGTGMAKLELAKR